MPNIRSTTIRPLARETVALFGLLQSSINQLSSELDKMDSLERKYLPQLHCLISSFMRTSKAGRLGRWETHLDAYLIEAVERTDSIGVERQVLVVYMRRAERVRKGVDCML